MLAMAQSQLVANALLHAHPGLRVELVPIVTSGDRYFGPLHTVGGKGLFTAELENGLCQGEIDLAIHSAKDMPAELGQDLAILAVPRREDPRDALISSSGHGIEDLPAEAVVGTSSLRRAMQLRARRADLRIIPLRGNIETRIRKILDEHAANATVLAMAGLTRSAMSEPFAQYIRPLDMDSFVPAAGQGALALQGLASNEELAALVGPLNDVPSQLALAAERDVVRGMQVDCHSSFAVHVRPWGEGWRADASASRGDGSGKFDASALAPTAAGAAQELLEALKQGGVAELLKD